MKSKSFPKPPFCLRPGPILVLLLVALVTPGLVNAGDINVPASGDVALLPFPPAQAGDEARHHPSSPAGGQPRHLINHTTQAVSPLTFAPLLTGQVAKLTASDAAGDDEFGWSVASSGDTAVVGAYLDGDAGSASGSAYVFERNRDGTDAWGQVAKLTALDAASNDNFGYAVAISGDTVVVGAYLDDDGGGGSGSAYVFERNQGGADAWGQVAKLTASDAAGGDQFGNAVTISDDTVVVGAYLDDDGGGSSGSAYVFERNQGGADAWGQVAKLTASDAAGGDWFGQAVAISDDTVVVGAMLDNDGGSASGSAYIFERNQGGADAWGQVAKLTASDAAAFDNFGNTVAVSGDTVVVGANGDDDGGDASGSAYIFERNQGGADAWGQVAKLIASDAAADDQFGRSVAISVDTIAVGARWDDDNGSASGLAYIFERNQGGADAWGQVAKLIASDAAAGDEFGTAVAISGDTIVAGARWDDDAGNASGSAYTFVRSGNAWEQIQKAAAADAATDDQFGWSVAISGDTAVVGAYLDDDGGNESGSAYVFERNQSGADSWGQVAKLTASDPAADDQFGWSVAISGDTVVVGAYLDDDGGSDSGSAYVFERNQGGADAWGQVAKLTALDPAPDDFFGNTVAISGDTVVVGAVWDDDGGNASGSAYVFERNQSGADAWGQVAKLTASDADADDNFGWSVAISGDTVVVGTWLDEDGGIASGSAYVFERNQGGADAWGQVAKLTASDATADDQFGWSVAISGDTVVIGAYLDDDGGSDSGSAYVFERNQSGADAWGQVAKLTASDAAVEDYFGNAVAISGDTIAVGAVWDDDGGDFSGSAYVFERNQGGADTWGQVAKLTASDDAADDNFGWSVGISGDTVAVGAVWDDDGGSDSGSAYIFGLTIGLPEMAVTGSDIEIANGNTTPSAGDQTDFGSVSLGGAITRTFTISNSGSVDLSLTGLPVVSMTGPAAGDFSVTVAPAASIAPGSTTPFQVRFDSSAVGTRAATVTIANDDSDENPYRFAIQGTGSNTAPMAAAGPDQNAGVGGPVTLDGSGSSDPDDHLPLTYGWTQTGGPAVSLSDSTVSQPAFTAPALPTVLTFSLTVTDAFDLADPTPDEVVVSVADSPLTGLVAINSSPTVLSQTTILTATITSGSNPGFTWSFGDGTIGSGATPGHVYGATGTYTAVVTASNSLNLLTATTVVTITGSGESNFSYIPLFLKNLIPIGGAGEPANEDLSKHP